jgi:microcystin-dependent protein
MDPLIGQIIMFGGNFEIRGFAYCSGQLLPIAQYTALFSILGTTYGGDGVTTFGLPDLRGRAPVGQGQGPGLSYYTLGEMAGTETATLNAANLPAHTHVLNIPVTSSNVNTEEPAGSILGATGANAYSPANTANGSYGSNLQTGIAGSNVPVPILNPFLVINYLIALEGIYPSRN